MCDLLYNQRFVYFFFTFKIHQVGWIEQPSVPVLGFFSGYSGLIYWPSNTYRFPPPEPEVCSVASTGTGLVRGPPVDEPLTAFYCLIPDLSPTQCPLAECSNPSGLVSIFSNGFTDADPLMGGEFETSH